MVVFSDPDLVEKNGHSLVMEIIDVKQTSWPEPTEKASES